MKTSPKIIDTDINKIVPYSKNAKVHSKKQIQQVANSIKEFGFNQAIVVDKKGVIIVGQPCWKITGRMDR